MFAGDKVVRLNYIFIREHADCVNKEPKDMIASMRWPVALVLVVGWNAPVLYYPRFSLSSAGLYRFIGLQVGILVVFFCWLRCPRHYTAWFFDQAYLIFISAGDYLFWQASIHWSAQCY